MSLCTASLPNFSFLAVRMTKTPFEASCLHISNPIPLLTPVTTACLHARISKSGKLVYNICLLDSILLLLSRPSHGHLPLGVIVKNKIFSLVHLQVTDIIYSRRETNLIIKILEHEIFPFEIIYIDMHGRYSAYRRRMLAFSFLDNIWITNTYRNKQKQ